MWDLPYDADGALVSQVTEYVVALRNVSRSMDLSRFHAFLQSRMGGQEDLDHGGPHPSTSTAWGLSLAMKGCPRELVGITRIMWYNTVIAVQHPRMRGRQQCLRCGGLGHGMRVCYMSVIALGGSGSLVAPAAELSALTVQPSSFTSLEELKQAVSNSRAQAPEIQERTSDSIVGVQAPGPRPEQQQRRVQPIPEEPADNWIDGGRSRKSHRGCKQQRSKVAEAEEHKSTSTSTVSQAGQNPGLKTQRGPLQSSVGSRYNPLIIESSDEKSSPEEGLAVESKDKLWLTAKAIRKAHTELLVVEDEAKAGLEAVLRLVSGTKGSLVRYELLRATRDHEDLGEDMATQLPQALRVMGLGQC